MNGDVTSSTIDSDFNPFVENIAFELIWTNLIQWW